MQAIHQFLGEDIAYSIQGKGRTLVFIHGFLGSKNCWEPLLLRLKSNFRVLAIDMPGHGQSNSIAYVHSMEMMAELVKTLLDKLKLRKVILIGHSMGGYVSLAFGEKYPDLVKGMILLNSTAAADSESRKKSRNKLIALLKKDREKTVKALLPSFFYGDSAKSKRLIRSYSKEAMKCSTRGIIACVEGMKTRVDREIVLKFAPYPYLVVLGENDQILDKNQQISEAELGEQGSAVLIENASHMAYLEEPGKLYKLIKKFGQG